jgi:hypothetical protein
MTDEAPEPLRIDGGDFILTWRCTTADNSRALWYGKRTEYGRYVVILFCFITTILFVSIATSIHHIRNRIMRIHFSSKYSGTSVYVLNMFQILGLIPNRTYTE